MKNLFLLTALVLVANSTFGQVYEREATHGEVGSLIKIYEQKKGYVMFVQDYRYDYVYEPHSFKFKKSEHLKVFVNNINTVLNKWRFDIELSKEDFPYSVIWEGVGYKLEKTRENPNSLLVKLNTDTDLDYDTFFYLEKEDVENLINLFG